MTKGLNSTTPSLSLYLFLFFYNFLISLFGTALFVVLRDSAFLILDPEPMISTRVCQICGSPRNRTATSARFFYHRTGLLRPVDLFTACFLFILSLYLVLCTEKGTFKWGPALVWYTRVEFWVGPWSRTSEKFACQGGSGED